MKESRNDVIFSVVNKLAIFLLTLVIIYPLFFIIIASISDPYQVSLGNVLFFPKGFTLEAYRNVFEEKDIWIGYRNSLVYLLAGTSYNLLLTIPAAYVLSKKNLPLRDAISWFFFITMYFGGGLVPTYILMRDLKLLNTPWVLIVGMGVSCYNLIVTRQFFSSSIPDELYEAGKIDGANDYVMFARIALPLSKPIIAIMALYYGIGHWNSYYNALIYVQKNEFFPLQLVLRNILILNQTANSAIEYSSAMEGEALLEAARRTYMANAMKYALIFISSAPMLIAYPFVQRFFVKGVMIGSVKG
ncbi:MAG: carbohydrate ABC transporter permease [Clostridia bacterium]|nr:carbohydrate ABC transporter permease [Clostridia bacterium]